MFKLTRYDYLFIFVSNIECSVAVAGSDQSFWSSSERTKQFRYGPFYVWKIIENVEELWKIMENVDKLCKILENVWKITENVWKIMKNVWKMQRNYEKLWKIMENVWKIIAQVYCTKIFMSLQLY